MLRFTAIAILVLLLQQARAQSASVTVRGPTEAVETHQEFIVRFGLLDAGGNFRAPDFGGLEIVSGPKRSTSQQWLNGTMFRSQVETYVLRAPEPGDYTISSAAFAVAGSVLETDPYPIQANAKGGIRTRITHDPTEANR